MSRLKRIVFHLILLTIRGLWRAQAQLPNCQLNITGETIADVWQSSSFDKYCIKNGKFRSIQYDFGYFHTDNGTQGDAGYHWFVLKLQRIVHLQSVTIASRASLSYRAANIEVYTSNQRALNFGSEHCSSRNISSQFHVPGNKWQMCAKTIGAKDITSGQLLAVECQFPTEALYLLLRKKIGNGSDEYMNFMNMWITEASFKAQLSEQQPTQGSSITLSCVRLCQSSESVELCNPDNICRAQSSLRIANLQPEHSGNYTCKTAARHVSGVLLTVLYPPEDLKISSLSQVGCGADEASSSDVTFQFSSSRAEPVPAHSCSVLDASGQFHPMREQGPLLLGAAGNATSVWLCSECSRSGRLRVTCSAEQTTDTRRTVDWRCEPPANLLISFTGVEESAGQWHLSFTFVSFAAHPAPKHKCMAKLTSGSPVEELAKTKNALVMDTGYTRTHWIASIPLPQDEVHVECSAAANNAWSSTTANVWRKSKTVDVWVYVVCTAGAIVFSLTGIALYVCCYCKRLPVKPIDLVRAGAAGTAHAMRCLSVAGGYGHHAVGPNQLYDNAEADQVYEVLHKISEPKNNTYI